MLHRNINLRGPLPFGRDFRALEDFLKSVVRIFPFPLAANTQNSPVVGDIEVHEVEPLKAEIRFRSKAVLDFFPGPPVTVFGDNTVLVRRTDDGAEVTFHLLTR